MVAERAHLSIGEVLSLLREEFPDVTISKIRFLESQGLLDPERTPSGYRKFYDEDVERLRWILRQQRENFLPLKVIKGRLVDHPDGAVGLDATMEMRSPAPAPAPAPVHGPVDGHVATPTPIRRAMAADPFAAAAPGVPAGPAGAAPAAVAPSSTSTSSDRGGFAAGPPAEGAGPSAGARLSGGTAISGGAGPVGSGPSANSLGGMPGLGGPGIGSGVGAMTGPSGGNYTLDELAAATSLSEGALDELSRFGLISGRDVGGTVYYDEEAATVAALAAGFARHGIEARHLRMYKNAAERESALFEQIVMPLVKQRNPQARLQAATALEDLGRLSGELRRALLRQALGNAF